MTSQLDRFSASRDAWRPDGARCGNTVPIDAAATLSPFSELVAAGVRLRNAQRRWAAGDRTDEARDELARATAVFDELLSTCED